MRGEGYPEPGKTTVYDESETIDPDTVPLNGGFLVKTLVLSIDPYLRGKMRDPSIKSYSVRPMLRSTRLTQLTIFKARIHQRPTVSLPAPHRDVYNCSPRRRLENFGVGVVVRSEAAGVKQGDHIYGIFPFVEYWVAPKLDGFRILENKENLPWSAYVGVAGMPGQTAYCAWKEFAHAKKGETVFVTAGSGAYAVLYLCAPRLTWWQAPSARSSSSLRRARA